MLRFSPLGCVSLPLSSTPLPWLISDSLFFRTGFRLSQAFFLFLTCLKFYCITFGQHFLFIQRSLDILQYVRTCPECTGVCAIFSLVSHGPTYPLVGSLVHAVCSWLSHSTGRQHTGSRIASPKGVFTARAGVSKRNSSVTKDSSRIPLVQRDETDLYQLPNPQCLHLQVLCSAPWSKTLYDGLGSANVCPNFNFERSCRLVLQQKFHVQSFNTALRDRVCL